MICDKVKELLPAYLCDDLDDKDIKIQVKEHLLVCKSCKDEFNIFTKTIELMNYSKIKPSDKLLDSLLAISKPSHISVEQKKPAFTKAKI
jgi:predicted anti-sigma-YlaC factor YlaD